MTSTIHADATTLSDLLQSLRVGDEVIITAGSESVPVARLEAITPVAKTSRRLGFLANPKFVLPDDFFEEDLDGEAPEIP
jgi:antitoxin (DNA-binding transcriptional repressor) of toxin-antitoxin stability system